MRKTFKDYNNEYNEMLKKQKGLEARIKERAKIMSNNHPNVTVAYKANDGRTPIKAPEYFKEIDKTEREHFYTQGEYVTRLYLYIIEVIEKHNEEQANIKQLKMFD